jgi:hypothetical protein
MYNFFLSCRLTRTYVRLIIITQDGTPGQTAEGEGRKAVMVGLEWFLFCRVVGVAD